MACRPLVALRPLVRGVMVVADRRPSPTAVSHRKEENVTQPSTIRSRLLQPARAAVPVALLMIATALPSASAQQATRLRVAVDAAPRAIQPPRPTSFRPMLLAADSSEHG